MSKPMKLVDIEATASLAVDGSMTWEQIRQWVAEAIEAKLDYEREQEDWGGGVGRVYINGEPCTEAHLADAL